MSGDVTTLRSVTTCFFSATHNSYSKIDYFLVDKWFLQQICKSNISSITWSDHAPISITINLDTCSTPTNIQYGDPTHLFYVLLRTWSAYIVNWRTSSTTMWDWSKALPLYGAHIRRLSEGYSLNWASKLRKKGAAAGPITLLYHQFRGTEQIKTQSHP